MFWLVPQSDDSWTMLGAVVAIAAVGIASVLVPMRFHHDGGVQGFNLLTGTLVAMLVLAPAPTAIVITFAVSVAAQLARKAEPVKFGFNVAQDTLVAVVAAGAYVVAAGNGTEPFGARGVFAILLAVLVAEGASTLAMAELFRRLDGRALVASIQAADVLGRTGAVLWTANSTAAVLLALLAASSPWLVMFALPPLAGVFLAYQGYIRQAGERTRAEALQCTSRRLVEASTDPSALYDAIEGLRDLFSGVEADLVPRGLQLDDPQRQGVVDRVLATGRAESSEDPAMLAAPVVLDGHVVAVVQITGRRGFDSWQPADLALLGTVAEEIGSAMRTRELLSRLQREREATEVESTKLADIVGAASDGILLLGTDGTVLTFNPAMELLTGLTAADVVDRSWSETLVMRDARDRQVLPEGWDRLAQALRGEVRLQASRIQLQRSDGQWRWLRGSSSPVLGDDGMPRGVVLVLQDRTREVEVDQLRAEFVATVSHELRTPLTPLRGFLEMLTARGGTLEGPEVDRALSAMGSQLSRLETLIADLLVVAEIQRGNRSVAMSPVPVREAVIDAALSEAVGIDELRLEHAVPAGLAVLADRAGLVRILRSLVSNGLKHTTGTVHVTAQLRSGEVAVVVADDGPGIGRWGREVVFEPFGRLGDHLVRPAGPGLGLAIARSLAEGMGGRLELLDTSVGACFELVLPAAGGPGPAPAPQDAPALSDVDARSALD
jgi:PAS domain S-box-containing protein